MIKKETFNLMESIQQFFPHFEITQSKIDLWQRALAAVDYETAENNLLIYVKQNRFAPTVSDIANEPKEEDYARRSVPTAEETKKYLDQTTKVELTEEQKKRIEEHQKEIRKMLGVE